MGNKTDTTKIQTQKVISEPTYISLSSIDGLHPRIIELDKEYAGISPNNLSSIKISEEALASLMVLNPIIIRRTKTKVLCVGNTCQRKVEMSSFLPDRNVRFWLIDFRQG